MAVGVVVLEVDGRRRGHGAEGYFDVFLYGASGHAAFEVQNIIETMEQTNANATGGIGRLANPDIAVAIEEELRLDVRHGF